MEFHRDRVAEARERLDHTLAADLFATSIANGAFGLALVNPPYDWDQEDKRIEHAFLIHCTRYLAEGGLLVFIVPRQRLGVSARYRSTRYRKLNCWAMSAPRPSGRRLPRRATSSSPPAPSIPSLPLPRRGGLGCGPARR